jgi:hypothetical protein
MILFLAHVVIKVTMMMMNLMNLTILAICTIISINLLMMMKEMKKFVMILINSYSMILMLLMKSHKTMSFRIMDFSLPMLAIHFATFSIMIVWNGFLDMLFSTRLLFAQKDMEGHKYLACSNKGTSLNISCLLHLIAKPTALHGVFIVHLDLLPFLLL